MRKVRSGERLHIPADAWNRFIDIAERDAARSLSLGAGEPIRRRRNLVRIRNDSGADIGRFEILGVDSPIFAVADQAFKNDFDLAGSTPSTSSHLGKFVVAAEPIAAGAVGRAFASGLCPVRVDVTNTDHDFADVADADSSKLFSGRAGAAAILWSEGGTGEQWAIVRIGVLSIANLFAGKITAVDSPSPSPTYSAKALHDPSITVTGEAPIWRLLDEATFDITAASVNDPCILIELSDTMKLAVALTEQGQSSDCQSIVGVSAGEFVGW